MTVDLERIEGREMLLALEPTLRHQACYIRDLIRYRAGSCYPSPIPVTQPHLPSSGWAEASTALATSLLSPAFLRHSMRAWHFAAALSGVDGVELDSELGFVVAVLHDIGLFQPISQRCFTLAGAAAAQSTAASAGVPPDRAGQAANAIFHHISLTPPRDPTSFYLQVGSLLDVTGSRVWDLDAAFVAATCRRWPRQGFYDELRSRWQAECKRFPRGRASYARWPGCLLVAARHAPLRDPC